MLLRWNTILHCWILTLYWAVKQSKLLIILTCYDSVEQKSIDWWMKKNLNDPFSFVKPSHNNLYKPSTHHSKWFCLTVFFRYYVSFFWITTLILANFSSSTSSIAKAFSKMDMMADSLRRDLPIESNKGWGSVEVEYSSGWPNR